MLKQKKLFIPALVILILIALVSVSGCTLQGSQGGYVCNKVVKEFKVCDKVSGCRCLHQSWGGLGSCDTCECEECSVKYGNK